MRILIAGGGASGMTAAIAAARRDARVTILEKKETKVKLDHQEKMEKME